MFRRHPTRLLTSATLNTLTTPLLLHLLIPLLIGQSVTAMSLRGEIDGIYNCYNKQDCLGANRECLRNATMRIGMCICKDGYKKAVDNSIKCLNIADNECDTSKDCPATGMRHCVISLHPAAWLQAKLGNDIIQESRISSGGGGGMGGYPFHHVCSYSSSAFIPIHRGGGGGGGGHSGRPGEGSEAAGTLYPIPVHGGGVVDPHGEWRNFNRFNRISPGALNPEYIQFVEDCMLVLLLFCVLVTLLVVHRASCYRQFRRARRDGPLRYIIPSAEDQPPPYPANFGPAGEGGAGNNANAIHQNLNMTVEDGLEVSADQDQSAGLNGHHPNLRMTGVRKGRSETPPPTYDEALAISQAISASMVTSDDPLSGNDLYISLPSPAAATQPAVMTSIEPPPPMSLHSSQATSGTNQISAAVASGGGRVTYRVNGQVMLDGVTATSPGAVIRTQLVVDSRGRCTAATAQTNGLTTNITPVPHPQLSPNPTTEGATTTTSIVVQSDPQQSASSTQNIDPPSSTVNNANAPGTGSGTQPNPLC